MTRDFDYQPDSLPDTTRAESIDAENDIASQNVLSLQECLPVFLFENVDTETAIPNQCFLSETDTNILFLHTSGSHWKEEKAILAYYSLSYQEKQLRQLGPRGNLDSGDHCVQCSLCRGEILHSRGPGYLCNNIGRCLLSSFFSFFAFPNHLHTAVAMIRDFFAHKPSPGTGMDNHSLYYRIDKGSSISADRSIE